jgi:ribonuclease P protein component
MAHQGASLGGKNSVVKITLKSDFDAVMSAGVYVSTTHFALHVQRPVARNRIGAVVPKRWAKQAVTRNAIKRQIYGLALVQDAQTPAADLVVRLRKTFQRTQFVSATSQALKRAVRSELVELFEKLSHTL